MTNAWNFPDARPYLQYGIREGPMTGRRSGPGHANRLLSLTTIQHGMVRSPMRLAVAAGNSIRSAPGCDVAGAT